MHYRFSHFHFQTRYTEISADLEFGNGIPNHSYDSLEMEMNLVKLWNGMEMEFGMSKVFGNGIGVWNRMHVATLVVTGFLPQQTSQTTAL